MSNTNYDVELPISYDHDHRHYFPYYSVAVPYWWGDPGQQWFSVYVYETAISFDNEQETQLNYKWESDWGTAPVPPPDPCWNTDERCYPFNGGTQILQISGVYSKVYFRNPRRENVQYNSSNCHLKVNYSQKAAFEVQLNSSGYVAPTNASFKCSTIEKNIPVQYSWSAATVYYKKTTDANYSSVAGTVSGTWSDITVSTNLSLPTGYTYDIYIRATADDGTVANTGVSQFASTDSEAVTKCVSPSGIYTSGTVNFIWSHSTEYGTPQYAYDLQYSDDNGGTWTTVSSHVVTQTTNKTVTIEAAGVYVWRVRTYNSLDQAGSWATASFINSVPAAAPTNFTVTTKGRPTASWVSTVQSAYQVQVLLNNEVVYDSGAIYTGQNSHFIDDYFDDTRAYTVRVRIYNSLGNVSPWVSTGYQQPSIPDVSFSVEQIENGGAVITVALGDIFSKYYLKRNDVLIAEIPYDTRTYTDKYAVGNTNYSVVAVTSADQSDIKSKGVKVTYPHASIVTLDGVQYWVNRRVDNALEVKVTNSADINKVKFIGDSTPTHFFNKMKLKSFSVTFFDDYDIVDDLLGSVVFYADNFGNGGYCVITDYDRTENFVQNSAGTYANEVSLTLEVTNYDDSIQYPI